MECMREKFYDGVVLDGRFKTISPLNHGSFGMVFMAKDLTTDNLVAIKCLTKKTATSDDSSSFAIDEKSEELACHARLGSHPNIVNLLHSFETDAHTYLVLEFCSRGDLYEAIRNECGPLETEHVREFMLQLVDAVAYIHSKGMYHRDIKPENIFLTESGMLKLGDFGLATTDTWSYETTVGSDRYMSPEQYDSAGAGYSPAQADIWAIGICLLNVLFSRNPFTTPTEADPLFLDFSRDKQSLFDVFPTMSQDTFEVIANCMSLDPTKRSLTGAREALLRAVAFTTFDDIPDEFLNSRPTATIAGNREPLRTPSVQSPQLEQGSFPWAKALHSTPPQAIRQLSVIADTESYSEDLFPKSEESQKDWCSISVQTPSMGSMMESSLGASLKSLAMKRPTMKSFPRADLTPISGSLPISMAVPKTKTSMSLVFGGKRDMVSKSWEEIFQAEFDDDDEEPRTRELRERKEQNARTWSHESRGEGVTTSQPDHAEPDSPSFVNIRSSDVVLGQTVGNDIDSDTVTDGFFFPDSPARQYSPPRYSPPNKRAPFDKWVALGERRRAATQMSAGTGTGAGVGTGTAVGTGVRRDMITGTGMGTGIRRNMNNAMGTGSTTMVTHEFWRGRRNAGHNSNGFGVGVWDKDRVNHHMNRTTRESPWGARDRDQRKEKDLGDLEWVGGWHDFA